MVRRHSSVVSANKTFAVCPTSITDSRVHNLKTIQLLWYWFVNYKIINSIFQAVFWRKMIKIKNLDIVINYRYNKLFLESDLWINIKNPKYQVSKIKKFTAGRPSRSYDKTIKWNWIMKVKLIYSRKATKVSQNQPISKTRIPV